MLPSVSVLLIISLPMLPSVYVVCVFVLFDQARVSS